MRNALAHAGRGGRQVVSALIATAFAQAVAEADVLASMTLESLAPIGHGEVVSLPTLGA